MGKPILQAGIGSSSDLLSEMVGEDDVVHQRLLDRSRDGKLLDAAGDGGVSEMNGGCPLPTRCESWWADRGQAGGHLWQVHTGSSLDQQRDHIAGEVRLGVTEMWAPGKEHLAVKNTQSDAERVHDAFDSVPNERVVQQRVIGIDAMIAMTQ
ncbi:hypothetical protein ACFV2U_13645 [Streptomyces sp. NPDC059697]|uniref:hypothetical protein n=1 Tax=Streptomyces sp. NPDC059697 TaxID=3346912 RepID=UPI0036777A60